MQVEKHNLGKWGEELAARFLMQHGYAILERNVRTPYGEIDLVARLNETSGSDIVMVEVKTRQSTSFGFPEESISHRKRMHLINAAAAYMQLHPELGSSWRIDVIAIQKGRDDSQPSVKHFINAVN